MRVEFIGLKSIQKKVYSYGLHLYLYTCTPKTYDRDRVVFRYIRPYIFELSTVRSRLKRERKINLYPKNRFPNR